MINVTTALLNITEVRKIRLDVGTPIKYLPHNKRMPVKIVHSYLEIKKHKKRF